jgi:hypothetical protein
VGGLAAPTFQKQFEFFRKDTAHKMKKFIRLFSSSLNPLLQISGVSILAILSFLNISGETFKNQIKIYLNNNFLLILAIFTSGVFFWIVVEKIFLIIKNYKQFLVEIEIEKINSQTDIQNIERAIPNNNVVKIWSSNISDRSKTWATDAKIISYTMFFHFDSMHWTTPSLQVYYYSQWKDETAIFYEGKNRSEYFEEGKSLPLVMLPFTESVPNWRNLLKHAFEAISSHLASQCDVFINCDRISISFREGKVKRNITYRLIKDNLGTYNIERV